MMSDELASAASANANASCRRRSPYSLPSRAAGAVRLAAGHAVGRIGSRAQGFDASSASFATVSDGAALLSKTTLPLAM